MKISGRKKGMPFEEFLKEELKNLIVKKSYDDDDDDYSKDNVRKAVLYAKRKKK